MKYQKIEDAIKAHDELKKQARQIEYVPTKHNSDEVSSFTCFRTKSDEGDATFTLNMFKIKPEGEFKNQIPQQTTLENPLFKQRDSFVLPHKFFQNNSDEVENLYD